jgi:hypothetical protein
MSKIKIAWFVIWMVPSFFVCMIWISYLKLIKLLCPDVLKVFNAAFIQIIEADKPSRLIKKG